MSIKVMDLVWQGATDVQGSDIVVFLALADWSNDQGACWPGIDRLAAKARVSVRTVQYVIHRLEAAGYLTVEVGRGRHHTSEYSINTRRLEAQKKAQELHPLDKEGVQGLHPLEKEKVQNTAEKVQVTTEKVQPIAPNTSVLTVSIDPSVNSDLKKPKRKKPMVDCPADFRLTDDMEATAREIGFKGNRQHLEFVTQTFLDHHTSKGTRFADWVSAWRTWIRNSITYGQDIPKLTGSDNGTHRQNSVEIGEAKRPTRVPGLREALEERIAKAKGA